MTLFGDPQACKLSRMPSVEVKPCSQELIDLLERLDQSQLDLAHHRERWDLQQQGLAIYLTAWQQDQVVGRMTLLKESKYQPIRDAFPGYWEMNALEARPQGRGVGTVLINTAEQWVAESGGPGLGVGVGPDNNGARRLYERLGYVEWSEGRVIDEWDERDESGRLVRAHADECLYLLKSR